MRINLFPLAVIVYTDNLPEDIAGQARGPVALIKTKYRDDVGLLAHELTHVAQWWVTFGLHSILYALCRPYRLWAECLAYREQMTFPDRNGHFMTQSEAAALLMLPRYDLNLTAAEALAAINWGSR